MREALLKVRGVDAVERHGLQAGEGNSRGWNHKQGPVMGGDCQGRSCSPLVASELRGLSMGKSEGKDRIGL